MIVPMPVEATGWEVSCHGGAVREYRIDIPDADLVDLRERLARARWPEAETVDGWTQGVPLDYSRELCEYWRTGYDWRRVEAEINSYEQFRTGLDGGGDDACDIHVLHARSRHENALPLLLTHGWPGSIVEFLDILPLLTDPDDPADAFHVICPSLPGYGFSGKPTVPGWGVERIAVAWAQLMDRLGHERYAAQGGDWGSMITAALGSADPEHLVGIHLTMALAEKPEDDDAPLSADEKAAKKFADAFRRNGTGYSAEQSTRPQTIGYGLVDSPVAQCTWIVEKFWDWTDCAGNPENAISRDRLLDNVMMYWLNAAGASSARLYWESFARRRMDEVTVPTAVAQFPHEMRKLPRRWLERRFTDIRRFSVMEVGGHFASLEQPETFVDDVRAFFRDLR